MWTNQIQDRDKSLRGQSRFPALKGVFDLIGSFLFLSLFWLASSGFAKFNCQKCLKIFLPNSVEGDFKMFVRAEV